MNEKNKINEMEYSFIRDYITEEKCSYMCDDKIFDCNNCSSFLQCLAIANNRYDNEYISIVNCGGYQNEENFWEQI